MIRLRLILAMAICAAWAQAQNSSTPQTLPTLHERASQDAAAALPPTAPVITVHGLCATPAAAPNGCTTVITKDEFDQLIKSLPQRVPPNAFRDIAQRYVKLLAMTEAARKAGTENDPKYLQQLKLNQMQLLASVYGQSLQEKLSNPAPAEIEAYYKANAAKYEQVKLRRVFIPRGNPNAANKEEFEKKATETANAAHARVAKGEDPEAVQKDVFKTLGIDTPPPTTEFGARRKGSFPPKQDQELFSLPPGGVSSPLPEGLGIVFYKVEGKDTVPLEQVKDQIAQSIARDKIEQQIKTIEDSVKADFNDTYFGAAPTPPPSLAAPAQKPVSPK
jgi:PPIC-type PPIASE domain